MADHRPKSALSRGEEPAPTPASLRWLGDPRSFGVLAAALLGAAAVLKGLRWPSDWALTQGLLDYSQGFVKRGLLGSLYVRAGLYHRGGLSTVFFAELLLLLALLTVFTWRSGIARRFGPALVAALFAGSYAVTFLVHIVGYPDIVNAALTVALLLVRSARMRFAAAIPVFTLGLLVHENFLFLFAPAVLFSFAVQAAAEPQNRRQTLWFGALLLLLVVTGTGLIALRGPMPDDRIDAMQTHVEALSDFSVRDDFFNLLSTTLPGSVSGTSLYAWHKERWWEYQAVAVCTLGPVLLLLLHFARRVLGSFRTVRAGSAGGPWQGAKWLWIALLTVVATPLLLHIVAIDGVRWDVWCVVNAYLALGLLCMHLRGEQTLALSTAERNAVLLVIAMGMASGHGLFDGATVNPYPFFPRALEGHVLRHDGHMPGF